MRAKILLIVLSLFLTGCINNKTDTLTPYSLEALEYNYQKGL